MRVLGIDPSSAICGVALLNHKGEKPQIEHTWTWHKNKSKSSPWNLADYYEWLTHICAFDIDMACVEFLSVERNAQTTRKVSHYQAVSALACKQNGLMVIEARVSSARKEALGRGDLPKEAAWQAVKKLYPDWEFQRADRGGYDEADAVVLALAGPGIAEGA